MKRLLWILYSIPIAMLGLLLALINVRLYLPAAEAYGTASIPDDAIAQLRFLKEQLLAGSAYDMQSLFPEGYFFNYVLYGLSWVQVGLRSEGELRSQAVQEARWASQQLDTPAGRAPFSPRLDPAYGVFYQGWSHWLRGGILLLDSADASMRAQFERDSATLAQAFDASDTPFLSAYPGQAWPVDNVVAIASLQLHDRILPPRYQETISRWLGLARERLDPVTGLLPHRVDPTSGVGLETARGSSQSIALRFLAEIEPTWAAEQYHEFRRQFLDSFVTAPGIREYPSGSNGAGDVDSGPLINGLSASATVVTMGTAFLYGDRELGETLVHVGEAAAIPISIGDTKRYTLGLLPIADAFLVWSQTATPWLYSPAASTFPVRVSPGWRVPFHALSLGLIGVLLLPGWAYRLRGFRHR